MIIMFKRMESELAAISPKESISDLEKVLDNPIKIGQPEKISQPKTKKIAKRILDFYEYYFRPKFFEESGKLYESLGIRFFTKYCPNGGSKFSISGSLMDGKTKKDLQKLVNSTKLLEGIHLMVLSPYYSAQTLNCLLDQNYIGVTVWTSINLLANIYPIMSQRYNRNRAYKLIEKME